MIPYIENPNLYKQHFSKTYEPGVGDITLLCEGNNKPNFISDRLIDFQKRNKEEIDTGEIEMQIGGGDVQLVSPSEGALDRAKAELQREHVNRRKDKVNHSMGGRGKGKVKNNKAKSGRKSINNKSKQKSKQKPKQKPKQKSKQKPKQKPKQKAKQKSKPKHKSR